MHPPLRTRLRQRPALPTAPTTYRAGQVGLDIGPALFEALLRQALGEAGLTLPATRQGS